MRYESKKTKRGNVGISYSSQAEADAQAANMEKAGCSYCIDCRGCSDCSDCSGCSDCRGCSDCSGCRYCRGILKWSGKKPLNFLR